MKSIKPSILNDRGEAGSPDELDEYGVWVKSEPEDLQPVGADGFTGETQSSGASLSSNDGAPDDPMSVPDFGVITEEETPGGVSQAANFDDFFTESVNAQSESEVETQFKGAESGADEFNPEAGVQNEEAGIENIESIDEFSVPMPEAGMEVPAETAAEAENPVAEDFTLEEGDFNLKEEGRQEIELEDGIDIDAIDEAAVNEIDEAASVDISNETFDDFNSGDMQTMNAADTGEPAQDAVFDAETPAYEEAEPQPAAKNTNVNNELLLKIANELSSLKNEINSLKNEIAQIKSGSHEGFDESVALTSEQLNVVLENAEVIHETPDESFNLPADVAAPDLSLDNLDETVSASDEEFNSLDSADESISLTSDELSRLNEEDESISLTEDELKLLDNVEDAEQMLKNEADPFMEEAAGFNETISEPDFSNNDSSGIIDESGIELAEEQIPEAPLSEEIPMLEEQIEVPLPKSEQKGAQSPPLDEPAPVDEKFKNEIRTVLAYMDQLLEALPEEKIEEFARSDKFEMYKKVFKELGLV